MKSPSVSVPTTRVISAKCLALPRPDGGDLLALAVRGRVEPPRKNKQPSGNEECTERMRLRRGYDLWLRRGKNVPWKIDAQNGRRNDPLRRHRVFSDSCGASCCVGVSSPSQRSAPIWGVDQFWSESVVESNFYVVSRGVR